MVECKGFAGKLFGHDYKNLLVSSKPSGRLGSISTPKYSGPAFVVEKYFDLFFESITEREYKIVCTRCGKQIND